MDNQTALELVCQDFIHHVHMVIQSGDDTQLAELEGAGESVIYQRQVGGMRYTILCEPEDNQTFSKRQSEILGLMCEGKTTKQIAYHLHIKPATVDTYIRRIFGKLGVNSRVEVVARAFRNRRPFMSHPLG